MKLLTLVFSLLLPATLLAQWQGDATVQHFDGNVGIGTTAPQEKLHVMGSIRGNGSGGALRLRTIYGYLDMGPMNGSWAHFQTDMPKFYFNKPVTVYGAISSYQTSDLVLQTNDITRMTLLQDGTVQLGTDNAITQGYGAKLELLGASGNTDRLWLARYNNG